MDDALWTITFSKYDDAATLHTANFYAVNGSAVDYNVNVGFALAKGTTYKMTFSGPEGAKLNFPTVAASAVQENEDVDVKTAPGYWNDNNTVVFSGTVELSAASSSYKMYYTSTTPVVEWPSSGIASGANIAFKVKKPVYLSKINLKINCTGSWAIISVATITLNKLSIASGAVTNKQLIKEYTTTAGKGTINFKKLDFDVQLDSGFYSIEVYNGSEASGSVASCYNPTNYGSYVTNKDIEPIDAHTFTDAIPLIAQVTTSTYNA